MKNHAPTVDKIDDEKGTFYEELKRVFDKFPKYHTKMLLGELNAKGGSKTCLKQKLRIRYHIINYLINYYY
jgi:hypothetical protein